MDRAIGMMANIYTSTSLSLSLSLYQKNQHIKNNSNNNKRDTRTYCLETMAASCFLYPSPGCAYFVRFYSLKIGVGMRVFIVIGVPSIGEAPGMCKPWENMIVSYLPHSEKDA
jgi:hypothetical protein